MSRRLRKNIALRITTAGDNEKKDNGRERERSESRNLIERPGNNEFKIIRIFSFLAFIGIFSWSCIIHFIISSGSLLHKSLLLLLRITWENKFLFLIMLILTVTWIRWNPVMNIMEQYNNQVKGELDKEIKNKYKIFCNSIKEMRKETKDQVKLIKDQVNTIKQSMSQYEMGKITESDIVDIITSEIRKFKEDHVQVTDYAMQSAGASIIKSRTSKAYQTDHLNWMLFNSIHWRYSLIPEIMLQPDIYPGNCWAFTGKAGHALIRLADTIIPRAVTIQHVPRAISQIKDFSSAPRDFEVFGFNNEVDATGENLGQFTYDPMIQLIQSFRLRNKHAKKFRYVQLKIVNNWGNAEFTCIYRFRVHQEIPRQLYS